MLDDESRYHDLPDRTWRDPDGREIVYKARRLLTTKPTDSPWFHEQVAPGDRPDLLAFRTVRDPLGFWRLCEANGVADPFELTARPMSRVRVPPPGG